MSICATQPHPASVDRSVYRSTNPLSTLPLRLTGSNPCAIIIDAFLET